ncbi:hypothetical protein FA048_19605 [Pedobacter polaris]|uniref:Uncharacterized protein n=1 Tax=Pedobacter polaris TaxID=2571273 RepID=A0A4U1CEZ1_9SPHI|nr:hypothetical protein [Pedobacter polaris]TKC04133.1 hypothetical protein FA048_19605 [Pedobacter polaris]
MKKFELVIGSPTDYEELVVYIRLDDINICLIQKEEGINRIKIEFFNEKEITLYLEEFLDVLSKAKNELLK